jgi:hypothetical protein
VSPIPVNIYNLKSLASHYPNFKIDAMSGLQSDTEINKNNPELHICVVFLFCLRPVHPTLPVSLDCPFWNAFVVFSNVYLHVDAF